MTTYKCPVCNQGEINILAKRTGPPGFRDTKYHIVDRTCICRQ